MRSYYQSLGAGRVVLGQARLLCCAWVAGGVVAKWHCRLLQRQLVVPRLRERELQMRALERGLQMRALEEQRSRKRAQEVQVQQRIHRYVHA